MLVVASQTESQSFMYATRLGSIELPFMMVGIGCLWKISTRLCLGFFGEYFFWSIGGEKWKCYEDGKFIVNDPEEKQSGNRQWAPMDTSLNQNECSRRPQNAVGELNGNICHWNARNSAADDDPVTNRAVLVSNYITWRLKWAERETYLRLVSTGEGFGNINLHADRFKSRISAE